MSSIIKDTKKIDSIQKLQNRLEQCIKNEDFYFAQQLYRTIYARYKSLGDHGELKNLLIQGAITMLKHGEITAGTDLALLLIEELQNTKESPTEENMTSILQIFNNFNVETHPKKTLFIRKSVEWSCTDSNGNQGEPFLHNAFAKYFEDLEQYGSSSKHYVRGSEHESFAKMVSKWADKGYPNELDLFLTRSVLMYLCLKNEDGARIFYEAFLKLRTKEEKDTPLFNYCKFLLKVVHDDNIYKFNEINEKYKKSLERDSSFLEYLEQISKVIFGTTRPEPRGNIFSNLLRGLMQG